MTERLQALDRLIHLSVPLDKAMADLRKFEWDSESALVQLKASDLYEILTRFLDQEVTAKQVEEWANAVEGRDDIDYSDVSEAINTLANPITTKSLAADSAQRLIRDYCN